MEPTDVKRADPDTWEYPDANHPELTHPGLEHLSIVYVGDAGRGEALRAAFGACGAHLWPTAEVQEALAFYVFYLPDLVILDDTGLDAGNGVRADEVYEHLESVGAAPLLVLASSRLASSRLAWWRARLPASGLALPGDSPNAALMDAIAWLSARHRSAFKR